MDSTDRDGRIVANLPLARALARRYVNRGEPLDDLEQVATIGLIAAVDRFDPAIGGDFRAFATPTILGEIRRHFRDRTWTVRVPRGLKEDHARVTGAIAALNGRLGRSPSVAEIAVEAAIGADHVLDAIVAHGAYRPASLSGVDVGTGGADPLDVPDVDAGFEVAEGRDALHRALAALPERERTILRLRFDEGMLQSQIAGRMGISQVHVSRLITRAILTMRRLTEGDAG